VDGIDSSRFYSEERSASQDAMVVTIEQVYCFNDLY